MTNSIGSSIFQTMSDSEYKRRILSIGKMTADNDTNVGNSITEEVPNPKDNIDRNGNEKDDEGRLLFDHLLWSYFNLELPRLRYWLWKI